MRSVEHKELTMAIAKSQEGGNQFTSRIHDFTTGKFDDWGMCYHLDSALASSFIKATVPQDLIHDINYMLNQLEKAKAAIMGSTNGSV